MNDWQSKIQMSRRDGVKAGMAILGLLFLCIFAVWVITRFLRNDPPPIPPKPILPAGPSPLAPAP